ncbi:hypothetical protein M0R45_035712 [Rubus argutus]|uniref:Uncharacterized protein n=1 Tax=Rubus argutus TaxID=59490 RepID=A0AAW1VY81_RUBAR
MAPSSPSINQATSHASKPVVKPSRLHSPQHSITTTTINSQRTPRLQSTKTNLAHTLSHPKSQASAHRRRHRSNPSLCTTRLLCPVLCRVVPSRQCHPQTTSSHHRRTSCVPCAVDLMPLQPPFATAVVPPAISPLPFITMPSSCSIPPSCRASMAPRRQSITGPLSVSTVKKKEPEKRKKMELKQKRMMRRERERSTGL